MTLGTIQNDYFDHVRHVWDIFGTIRPLKIIFLDYILESFRLKMSKTRLLVYFYFIKGFTTFLRSETKSLDAYGQSIWRL